MSPRAFSESDRERIRSTLIDVAESHFTRFGYRRASIADIAVESGIGKGSLYLFFPSKAELFVAVALRTEEAHRRLLLDEMKRAFPTARERLRHFLRFSADALADSPLLSVMTDPQEAAALLRDLPVAVQAELQSSDDTFFTELIGSWQRDGLLRDVDPALFAALPRAIHALMLQRSIIGDSFPRVLDFVIDSLADALAPASDAARSRGGRQRGAQ
jgi:AcrR family transcriptional regulator